eukprot:9742209-Alexandrium_andersonii.AAC.1
MHRAESSALWPMVSSSMGSPLPATMQGLKTLALRTSSSHQDSCAAWPARRWHGVVAFGVARQLHALTVGTLDQQQVESVLPDCADGPPVGLALDHSAQARGQSGFEIDEE